MNQTFANNLQILAKFQPDLVDLYKNYTPSKVQKEALPHNDLVIEGEKFYGMESKQACNIQVSHFFKQPTHHALNLRNSGRQAAHQNAINHLNHIANILFEQGKKRKLPKTNLLVLGAGTGEFLPAICQRLEVRHIVVVEPDQDMLFHFLNHTDIAELLARCSGQNATLSFIQSDSLEGFEQNLKAHLETSGFNFFADVTLYRHYETPLFDNIMSAFKHIRGRLLSSWGFFDDETQGLRHTLKNIQKHKFASHSAREIVDRVKELQLVIVGNGPSLDKDIALLHEHRKQLVVMSCGTALGALLKSGITPDIHVEMERSLVTAQIQETWLQSKELANTVLFALSTVAPETTNRFEKCVLFPKASDLGSYILHRSANHKIDELMFCNPTVTNFALASSIYVGFKNIALLGCDYGFRDNMNHHSKASDYFNSQSRLNGQAFNKEITIVDNFGNPFYSTRILDLSRRNVEKLLTRHSAVNVRNCSDGAKIAGAEYLAFNEICSSSQIGQGFEPEGFVQQAKTIDWGLELTAQLNGLNTIVDKITEHSDLGNEPEEGLRRLEKLNQFIQNNFNQDFRYILFLGDFRYLALLVSGHLNRLSREYLNEYWAEVSVVFNDMIDHYKNELNHVI